MSIVREVAFVLAGCAACGFQPSVASKIDARDVPADSPISVDDAGTTGPLDAPRDACGVTDPSLRLCLELDESGLATATSAVDGSGKNHDPAIAGLSVVSRMVPATSQAAQLSATSRITLSQHSDFDLQHFTLVAWMKRGALDPTQTQGVIDTGTQYSLSIDTFGRVQCGVTHNGTTTYPGLAQTNGNEWDLVACTYDGANLCGYAFQNGSATPQTSCNGYTQSLDTDRGYGTTIGEWAVPTAGSQFNGSLDQIRIYARALSRQELCTAGGLSGC